MAAAKGNTYAAKERRFVAMLQRVLDNEGDGESLRKIALKLVECATEGQPWAVTEIANRLDGKPVQQVDMSGELSLTRTVRDLTDDELLRIATQAAQQHPDTDGQTIQ